MSEIPGGAGDFELLEGAIDEYLNLCSKSLLVIRQTCERNAQRMVAAATHVVQNDRCQIAARDHQVGRAISVQVRCEQRPGAGEIQRGKAKGIADVLKPARSKVAEHAEPGTTRILHDGRQIDPPVVVYVDSGQAPCPEDPVGRERNSFKVLAFDVLPQAYTGSAGMRDRYVHPAIFVEVEGQHAARCAESSVVVQRHTLKCPFALILEDCG